VSDRAYSKTEIMIAASARGLEGATNCFVGVGLPNIVCNLAQRTVARDLQLVYESGVFGARPERLPLSIGDPTLATGATAITSMFELFAFYLQAGLIDVAFLGGAQIDRFGNLNTTVIGPYDTPKVRLPGSGGANDIVSSCREIFVITKHEPRRFVERVDFITSPGYLDGGDARSRAGLTGAGPAAVVTDLGVLGFDPQTKRMRLDAVQPGVAVDDVVAATGFELLVPETVPELTPPTDDEVAALRRLRHGEDAPLPEGVAAR
jgi:glutaconate CoA-transferase subunit B